MTQTKAIARQIKEKSDKELVIAVSKFGKSTP